ncbi:prepilin-type N-terminal cleavage/methylation domain-containing protein [Lentilactobacillus senioris]|uniref:prepilin-type N-terminal cleavage/methylation domain-containing protein n=1 Tax=Lentilactobacillus senioris TaxID=931534 RepID=UPI002280AAFE|nr:prepilin-type N-terminal cleavage/methylation domain-containing protein [Lentilactobacillus senioris]MCY9806726.1 prepilin-type N-terminal cleavage/methylation domain-containing protein [Lentilactobacillus senioris]
MKLNKRKPGFTLVETICAMTITVLVLGIGLTLNSITNQKQVLAEQRFFETLKTTIAESSTSARIYRVELRITFRKDSDVLVQIKEKRTTVIRVIPIPRTIKLIGSHVVVITTTGFISPQTIHWYSSKGQLKYSQKFQLGWSGFKLEKKDV